MRDRLLLGALFLVCLVIPITGCTNTSGLDSIQVTPTAQSLTVGQTAAFTATGVYGNSKHTSTQTITSGVTWTSSTPTVATVNSSGVATAVGAGTTTITASAIGYAGPVSAGATITVAASGGGVAGGSIVTISIIPGSQSVSGPNQTSQFIAIGTTSSGATENLTNLVSWSTSSQQIATIGAATGIATAVGPGTTTITALYTSGSSGTTVTGTATFTVQAGASAEQYTAVTITPGTESLSASGQTGQFIALGTSGTTGLQDDVTNSPMITWNSSSPSVATVNATGLATGVSVGSTAITAELKNSDGSVVTGSANVSVTLTTPAEPLLSLTIIPNSISVGYLQETGQFLAIGTFSTPPYVRDLTNTVTWLSSAPEVFPISTNNTANTPGSQGQENAGVAAAWGSGGATIIAEAIATDGSVQTATATFNCPLVLPNPSGNPPTPGSCYGPVGQGLFSTLTVYNEGLNTTSWQITAPSATGTANVLHCGPGWTGAGGSVCTATYPAGTVVTVTATGGAFGGWSYNCAPTAAITAAGPNSCTVIMDGDDTVGGIFN